MTSSRVPLAISGEQVLLKVAATGLCHSDLHLIDGEFKDVIPLNLPSTPGHKVAGWVEKTGDLVPQDFVVKDDLAQFLQAGVVVFVFIVKVETSNCVTVQGGQE